MWILWLICCPLVLCDAYFSRESVTYLRNESAAAFGRAIALLAEEAVVCSSGAAHIFARGGASLSPEPVQSLGPPAPSPTYCTAVAASETTLAVADSALDAVYLYTRNVSFDGGNWTLTATLSLASSGFGAALEFGEGLLFVGAPQFNDTGCVFAYADQPPEYRSTGLLCPRNASGVPLGGLFGSALSFNTFLSHRLLVIGAPGLNRAYVFSYHPAHEPTFREFGEEFGELFVPNADTLPEDARFGAAVALDSYWLFIGAPGQLEKRFYTHTGAVHVYRYSAANDRFEHSQRLRRDPLELYAYYGAAVAVNGARGVGVVAAPGPGGNSVYEVQLVDGDWRRRQGMGGMQLNATYGGAMRMDYKGVVAGAPEDAFFRELNVTESEGVVYAYSLHFTNAATSLESFLF